MIVLLSNISSCSKKANISPIVQELLDSLDIDGCYIKDIDYSDTDQLFIDNTYIKFSKVSNYINEVLDFDYDYTIDEDGIVGETDVAVINIDVSRNGEILYSDDGIYMFVGMDCFDEAIEKSLVGKKRGEVFELKATDCANAYISKMDDATVKVEITEVCTYKVQEGATSTLGDSYGSFSEYYSHLYTMNTEAIWFEKIYEIKNTAINELVKSSSFSLDYDEIEAASYETVLSYEATANSYGMVLEEYYTDILQKNEDGFFQMCVEETQEMIKRFLVVGAVSEKYNIMVTEDEFAQYIDTNGINPENESDLLYAKYQYLENKMLLTLAGFISWDEICK